MIFCPQCPFQNSNSDFSALRLNIELKKVNFNTNDVLFSEEEKLNGLYCIRKGTCKVSKMGSNGRDQIIELLSKGTLLGIRSVLNGEKTNLKAVAIVPINACFISKQRFLSVVESKPKLAIYLLELLCNYIKKTDDKILDLGQKSLQQRAAKLLLSLPEYFEVDVSGFIDVRLRREDMANIIGVATESFIRTLSLFQNEKWIELQGKQIRLLNIGKLRQLTKGLNR